MSDKTLYCPIHGNKIKAESSVTLPYLSGSGFRAHCPGGHKLEVVVGDFEFESFVAADCVKS